MMLNLCENTRAGRVVGITVAFVAAAGVASGVAVQTAAETVETVTLSEGQQLFYSGRYEAAADAALAMRQADPENLASYELRTSALHFQIKRALRETPGKGKPLTRCEPCQALLTRFMEDFSAGQKIARAQVRAHPQDWDALFFLGKLDLNYVWLQLGTMGKRTGWSEDREGRKSLDAVLAHQPAHVRARVARAWIDYIVDTRVPRGTRWILGGGNKGRALDVIRQAAVADSDRFVRAEASFALWDMLVRERRMPEAVAAAQHLREDFPDNADLLTFLKEH